MTRAYAVVSLITYATGALIVDATAPTSDALNNVGRFTLDGALIVGLGVLWRAYMKKDDQVVELLKEFTKAMTMVTASVEKNSTAIEHNTEAVNEMKQCANCTSILAPAIPEKHNRRT